jgi:hypothetical protein
MSDEDEDDGEDGDVAGDNEEEDEEVEAIGMVKKQVSCTLTYTILPPLYEHALLL